jgi:formylglycine-generating enzyme required for sulfatase activity
VYRGGGWGDYLAYGCRAANRNYYNPGDQDSNLGFRVLRSSTP